MRERCGKDGGEEKDGRAERVTIGGGCIIGPEGSCRMLPNI